MSSSDSARPVRILREQVARKIAAGEVIDRPASVVRELVDNSLDARSDRIDVWIEDGGRRLIRVVDNGSGMDRADLDLCHRPHATSKIESEADLEHVSSLGFRGEALSSIAAVARLEITSARDDGAPGQRLEVHAGRVVRFEACQATRGTSAAVEDLFFSLPARRKFLKRAAAETVQCRSVLIDKAVGFPEVTFRLFVDGSLRLYLPPDTPEGRVLACYPDVGDRSLLSAVSGTGDGFELLAVTTGAAMLRRDRRLIQIFVNRRRVWEYALVQAVEHAFGAVTPGGSHPICFLLLRCEPQLVDFNIHPAKREVRFRNLPDIHRRTVETLSGYLRAELVRQSGAVRILPGYHRQGDLLHENPAADYPGRSAALAPPTLPPFTQRAATSPPPATPGAADPAPVYIGQVFNLFLLASRGDRLYIVDQHAGHERILFDRFRADRTLQELLVPIVMDVGDEEERTLLARESDITALGVRIERSAPRRWTITALATAFLTHQDEVVETIREITRHPQEIATRFYAQMACKAAVKQGDQLDADAARNLLQRIFSLPEPRCPHGRPLWVELTRDQLYGLVGRA